MLLQVFLLLLLATLQGRALPTRRLLQQTGPAADLSAYRRAGCDNFTSDQWQPLRPGFHITIPYGWMNDPHGMFDLNGTTHVFFQYNPKQIQWGAPFWGHVASRDLVHWAWLPPALLPDESYDFNGCWSGAATVADDALPILTYTAAGTLVPEVGNFFQKQAMAVPENVSDPWLKVWKKPDTNPFLVQVPPGGTSFQMRDPTEARHAVWIALTSPDNPNPLPKTSYALAIGVQTFCLGGGSIYAAPTMAGPWEYLGNLYNQLSIEPQIDGQCMASRTYNHSWPGPAYGGPCDQFGAVCRMWEVVDFAELEPGLFFLKWDDQSSFRGEFNMEWYVLGNGFDYSALDPLTFSLAGNASCRTTTASVTSSKAVRPAAATAAPAVVKPQGKTNTAGSAGDQSAKPAVTIVAAVTSAVGSLFGLKHTIIAIKPNQTIPPAANSVRSALFVQGSKNKPVADKASQKASVPGPAFGVAAEAAVVRPLLQGRQQPGPVAAASTDTSSCFGEQYSTYPGTTVPKKNASSSGRSTAFNHVAAAATSVTKSLFTGELDGQKYAPMRTDYGSIYASMVFRTADSRQVMFSWIYETAAGCQGSCSDQLPAVVERQGFKGVQTMPRHLSYDKATKTLRAYPVKETKLLRGKQLVDKSNTKISSTPAVLLPVGRVPAASASGGNITARQFEVQLNFNLQPTPGSSSSSRGDGVMSNLTRSLGANEFALGLRLMTGGSSHTDIVFKGSLAAAPAAAAGTAGGQHAVTGLSVWVDRSKAGGSTNTTFMEGGPVPLPVTGSWMLPSQKLSLSVWVDHTVIEVFALGGLARVTSRIYPEGDDVAWGLAAWAVAPRIIGTLWGVSADAAVWEVDNMWMPPNC